MSALRSQYWLTHQPTQASPERLDSFDAIDSPIADTHGMASDSAQIQDLLEPLVEVSRSHTNLLRAVVESWVDGILILSEQGQWIEANEAARSICVRLQQRSYQQQGYQRASRLVPEAIWQICQTLVHSRRLFPQQRVILESEIVLEGRALRVRVQWFSVEAADRPYLMVILEDRHRSSLIRASAEVDRFGLSPREAEVWMLHRTGHSYKDIAGALYISIDTVKKHLKSIRHKQRDRLSMQPG